MIRTPVVLVHGPWLHTRSWQPWIERFACAGFAAVAPGWPGEPDTAGEARQDPWAVPEIGLEALTDHYARIVRSADSPPVVIGHSVGGLIAQHLLGSGLGRAAIAIAAAPIRGVPLTTALVAEPTAGAPSATRTVTAPVLMPSVKWFRDFFTSTVPKEAPELFERYVIPASPRLLSDLAGAGGTVHPRRATDTANNGRGPLLLVSGQEDRLVPDTVTRAVYKMYGDSTAVSELKQFPDRGHSLTIDSGWRAVADHVLDWLARHGIRGDLS